MDMDEMVAKLRAGEPLYGKSEMDPYHQEVSASQSRYAQLKFRIQTSVKGETNVRYFSVFEFFESWSAWSGY